VLGEEDYPMTWEMKQADAVEILTLQDNMVDLATGDDTDMLKRAKPPRKAGRMNSVLAEHGFSALLTLSVNGGSHSLLFDFGFSEYGAASNADLLEEDLSKVEALVLSHGHMDHFGGLIKLIGRIGRKDIPLVVHPAAFRNPRYRKDREGRRIEFPPLVREEVQATGVRIVESTEPCPLLDGTVLFLGEVPRVSGFEDVDARRFYEEDGVERPDLVDDDTAIAIQIKEKGLVILTGCAHSGIINTVKHAIALTGVEKLLAVMGGFHLPTPTYDDILEPTSFILQDLDPEYVIPCHCTGRKAIMHIESLMPEKFLLNMAGTRLIFR